MIGILLMALIGWLIFVLGIVFSIMVLAEKDVVVGDKNRFSFLILIVFGLMGLAFNMPALSIMQKDLVTTYENPTSIIKTNDMTVVTHINGSEVYNFSFKEALYWNGTNLMVEIKNGKNIYGFKVRPTCNVVIK